MTSYQIPLKKCFWNHQASRFLSLLPKVYNVTNAHSGRYPSTGLFALSPPYGFLHDPVGDLVHVLAGLPLGLWLRYRFGFLHAYSLAWGPFGFKLEKG